jgi:hypothetical protein
LKAAHYIGTLIRAQGTEPYFAVVVSFMLLVLFFTVAMALQSQDSAPAGWQTVDFNNLFSFRLPAGFARRTSTGQEDERAEYYKGETKLVVVWGRTESPAYKKRQQAGMNDYHETLTRIRGQRASIRTYWQTIDGKRLYRAELNVGNWEKGEVQLYMALAGDDLSVIQMADQIFKSVSLPLPSPELFKSARPLP